MSDAVIPVRMPETLFQDAARQAERVVSPLKNGWSRWWPKVSGTSMSRIASFAIPRT